MKTFGVIYNPNLVPRKCCVWKDRWEMSKFYNHQNEKKMKQFHKIGDAHLQCVNNHYAKFEYKGINTVGVTDYTN